MLVRWSVQQDCGSEDIEEIYCERNVYDVKGLLCLIPRMATAFAQRADLQSDTRS